ncbi:hypothetical protein, variant [Exophiala sideris]|nr:hypothetical protein, variant [Exophiala sideris]
MVVRPGQHVGGDGRVYHPYLAHWREAWERSNTVDFLSILSDVFAKEPPVMSRGQQRAPPPVPRLPRELSGPPPPPKPTVPSSPTQAQGRYDVPPAQHPGRYDAPPPLPQPQNPRPYGNGDYMPQRTSSLRQSMLPQQQYRPPPQQYHNPPSTHAPRPQAQQQQQPPPPKLAPDLLDSPFDVTLPAQTPTPSNIPAPPIPVNPEKEALLTHLSHQITQSLHSQIAQSTSAIPALQSQNGALQSTLHNLSAELNNLQSLHSTLTSNLSLLSTSLSKSDNVISSAKKRAAEKDIPAVDDMLVPPTVVARQLYDTACEERGIEAAILALQEGFVRGRVGADVWSRKTRELAREGFKRKWMEKKVARGMGLDLSMYGS